MGALKTLGSFILAWIMFVLPFWGLTYISDWAGYSFMFENPEQSRDALFRILSIKMGELGYTFGDLYRLHIIIIGGLYVTVFRRLRLNPIIATLITITLYYVPIGNQIRFFMAFPLVILALYRFCNHQYVRCLMAVVLAILAHKTAVILFGGYAIAYLLSKRSVALQKQWIIIANIGLVILLHFSYLFDSKYDDYHYNVSSILGGIYNSWVYLIPLYLVFVTNKKIQQVSEKVSESSYRYLYAMSIGMSVFILAGLSLQILTNRFIATLVPIWLAYFEYCNTNCNVSPMFRQRLRCYAIVSVLIVYVKQYVIDGLFGVNAFLYEAQRMLLSYQL